MSSKYATKTTLMILIDALSIAYFSKKYVPFLYDLAQDGVMTSVDPLFAFRGIEATIFTGVWPTVHNVWTEFCRVNNQIEHKKDRLIQTIIKTVNVLPNDEFKAKLRYAFEKYVFQKPHKAPNLIPVAATAYFEPSQQKEITEPGAVGNIRTLFDVFRKKGIKFVFIEPWIWGDRGVVWKAKRMIRQEHNYHFWYLKFNHLDHLGHKFGPEPFAFKEQLMKIDMYVEEIVTLLLKKTNLNVLVLADHGMSKVRGSVDILERLNQLRARMYKDYLAFADSTMIRFWFFTKEAKQEIYEYLQRFECGHVISDAEKRRLKVPSDTKYGQMTYVLDEGYIVHPCFFHSKSVVKGMHGYAYPKTAEALPVLIMNNKIAGSFQINRQATYADITPLILHSLLPGYSTSLSS